MQKGHNTKAETIRLLEGRREESLEKIYQFILNLDERDYIEFLYPSDVDFAKELDDRTADAQGMLNNLRDIEATLRDMERGRIKIQ